MHWKGRSLLCTIRMCLERWLALPNKEVHPGKWHLNGRGLTSDVGAGCTVCRRGHGGQKRGLLTTNWANARSYKCAISDVFSTPVGSCSLVSRIFAVCWSSSILWMKKKKRDRRIEMMIVSERQGCSVEKSCVKAMWERVCLCVCVCEERSARRAKITRARASICVFVKVRVCEWECFSDAFMCFQEIGDSTSCLQFV